MRSGAREAVTRIVLVDAHTLFRDGVREILSAEDGFTVVGEAGDGTEAVRVVARTRPEVALLDTALPDPGPVLTVRRLLEAAPATRVIVVSVHDEPRLIQALLGEGVRGYLLKTVTGRDLVAAVRAVVADDERVVLSVSRGSLARVHGGPEPMSLLSVREREVMALVARGMTNAQIARRLRITEGTVKHHLRKVFAKLRATSRLDAVNKAVAASLIDRRDPESAP